MSKLSATSMNTEEIPRTTGLPKPIKEMTDQELELHLQMLRGNREVTNGTTKSKRSPIEKRPTEPKASDEEDIFG